MVDGGAWACLLLRLCDITTGMIMREWEHHDKVRVGVMMIGWG